MIIDSMFECENVFDSIRFNDDGDSNEIDESDSQFSKHDEPIISTWHGITIDSTFDDENTFASIRFNDDGDSNKIDESECKKEKFDGKRNFDEQGIQIAYRLNCR
jgi:hypothetical protein